MIKYIEMLEKLAPEVILLAYDLLIKNGFVVDGSGKPGFKGSVAVKDGRIAMLAAESAPLSGWESKQVIDAEGLVVSPGFIDMHSHSDWVISFDDHPRVLAPLLEQGITTVVAGNCGFSSAPLAPKEDHLDLLKMITDFTAQRDLDITWDSLSSFFGVLEQKGISLNLAMLTGQAVIRGSLFGREYVYPGVNEMAQVEKMLEGAFDDGSFGLSLGLGYEPGIFTDNRELEQLARAAAKHERILTVHIRALSRLSPAYPVKPFGEPHNLKALREVIEFAERAQVKLQVSHLIFVGRKTWPTVDRALEMIERAVARGVDIAFDSFPYLCGNTTIYVVYPTWFLDDIDKNMHDKWARKKLSLELPLVRALLGFGLEDIQLLWGGHLEMEQYNGMFFGQIGAKMGCSILDAYLKVTELSRGAARCLIHRYSGDEKNEAAYLKVLTHPLNLIETDCILGYKGLNCPSGCGTFPRLLQRYVRETGTLTLEEAVAKSTGKSASRFEIKERGTLEAGNWADITIFDLKTVCDNTSRTVLEARPDGIRHVFLNGEEVVRDGSALSGKRAGKILRCG